MTLEALNPGTEPSGRELVRVLEELQGLKVNVGVAAGANTNIAVAGIKAGGAPDGDTLVAVIEVVDPGSAATTPVLVDRTATTSITTDGNVQCTAATNASGAGARLIIVWRQKPTSY